MQAIGSVFRPAALFCTNKENFNLDNGDIATQLNSSNMLWCLSGNLALTHKILFGIEFEADGLAFHPFVPKALAGTRTLTNFKYRDAVLDITVSGRGNVIKSFKVNGKEQQPRILAKKAKGKMTVEIVMADNDIPALKVHNVNNAKAPLTPITWLEGTTLCWNPIEYIGHYVVLRNGKRIAETRCTTFDASAPGEYQVIGVSGDGMEGFASEPRSTRTSFVVEMPGEGTSATSGEMKNKPAGGIHGFSGAGFVEAGKKAVLSIPVSVADEGSYALSFRYANGNGPVNTRNRCTVRTLLIDGQKAGTVVLPQRGEGNWDDWGYSNSVRLSLAKGNHTVTLEFRPEDENMNINTNHALIDCLRLTKTDETK